MEVREVEINDYSKVADFLSLNFLPQLPSRSYLDKFNLWWDKNPFFTNEDIRGWILVDPENDLAVKGFLGNIPADYRVGEQVLKTASPSFWCVDLEYRTKALDLLFPYIRQNKDILVNSTPGPVTEKIFAGLGFKNINNELKSYMHFCNVNGFKSFLARKIKNKLLLNLNVGFLRIPLFIYNILTFVQFVNGTTSVSLTDDSIECLPEFITLENLKWLGNENFKIKACRGKYGLVISQYVQNQSNGLNYLEIVYSQNMSLKYLRSLKKYLMGLHGVDQIDTLVIRNSSKQSDLRFGFVDVTKFTRTLCLVKGPKAKELEGKVVTSIFGEKGFMLWN